MGGGCLHQYVGGLTVTAADTEERHFEDLLWEFEMSKKKKGDGSYIGMVC